MVAEHPKQSANLPRLAAHLLLIVGLWVQEVTDIAVAKSVDGELSSQQLFDHSRVVANQRVQATAAVATMNHRLDKRSSDFPNGVGVSTPASASR